MVTARPFSPIFARINVMKAPDPVTWRQLLGIVAVLLVPLLMAVFRLGSIEQRLINLELAVRAHHTPVAIAQP